MKKEDILNSIPNLSDEDVEKILMLYTESMAEYEASREDGANEDALKEAYEKGVLDAETRFSEAERERLLIDALDNSGAKSTEALKALLKLEEITLENGSLKGFDEQLELLKKEYGFLFDADENKPRFTAEGNKGGDSLDFSRLGYKDRLKLYRENPELYKEFVRQ